MQVYVDRNHKSAFVLMSASSTALRYSATNPFLARLMENRALNCSPSAKTIAHLVIDIADSGMTYECGDSLGVQPINRCEDVDHILRILQATGDEKVSLPKIAEPMSFRDALQLHLYFLAEPGRKILELLAAKSGGALPDKLQRLLLPEHHDETKRYLQAHHYADILEDFPDLRPTPQEFCGVCRRLTPRLYSIASSPRLYPEEVHLTVAVVRYEIRERERVGVASTWLWERVPLYQRVLPVFVAASHFRPPTDPDRAMIMVGPGTGVAPFRAFLQDRQATGAKGRNWLFFGAPQQAYDFLYREEFLQMQADGLLTRLSLAWSRDQADKIYVQHRMLEEAAELWRWIEGGAHFYVCGDKARMAEDVDRTLHRIIQQEGGMSEEAAAAYVKQMKQDKRYQRDVY